jgi:hypothetical protein
VPAAPPRDVTPGRLMRAAPSYAGRLVRVHLPARSYSAEPWGVALLPLGPGSPTALVFECDRPPRDNSRDLALTGVVRPVTPDGIWRLNGVTWETRLRDCSVTFPRP